MLKKMMFAFAAVCAAAVFTACSTCDTATTLNDVKLTPNDSDVVVGHMTGKIWGIYMFHALPLFSGSSSVPGTCAIFKSTVKSDNAVAMVTKKAKQMGASRILDLQTEYTNFPILFLFSYKAVDVSATAVK